MPDYIYQLESRLSAEQRAVVLRLQELAREQEVNVYLTGGAVRDLISGAPIRDLDFTVEGNPTHLAREFEKGGARIVLDDEKHRHIELIFTGDVDGSISAAREDHYPRPGAKPEIRWAPIIEDLRRRDFSLNAIAISLNPNSRGLLLDPTNGLADIEINHEVRALSMHSFTNAPIRLLRVLRYAARLGYKLESRTQDWFALAIERRLHEQIPDEAVGREVTDLSREDNPGATLKFWEARELTGAIHPNLPRRHPDFDGLHRLARARELMLENGLRPRLAIPVLYNVFGRLSSRERIHAMHRLGFRNAVIETVTGIEDEAAKLVKILAGRKTNTPIEAYRFLDKTPLDMLAFILAESKNSQALSKIRNFIAKWRTIRASLPYAELESLGVARGPQFDKFMEEYFRQALLGKGKLPEDRTKLLKRIAGIKDPPKKKVKEEKPAAKPKKTAKGDAAKISPTTGKGTPATAAAPGPAGKGTAAATQSPVGKLAKHVAKPAAEPASKPTAKKKSARRR